MKSIFTFRYMHFTKKKWVLKFELRHRKYCLLFSCLSHLNGRFFLLLFFLYYCCYTMREGWGPLDIIAESSASLEDSFFPLSSKTKTFLFHFSLLFRIKDQSTIIFRFWYSIDFWQLQYSLGASTWPGAPPSHQLQLDRFYRRTNIQSKRSLF